MKNENLINQETNSKIFKQMQDKEFEDFPQKLGVIPSQISIPNNNNQNLSISIKSEKDSKKKYLNNQMDSEDAEFPQDPPIQQIETIVKNYKTKESMEKMNEKSPTILSESSLKPRKGDINITPRSSSSKVNLCSSNEEKKIQSHPTNSLKLLPISDSVSLENENLRSLKESKDNEIILKNSPQKERNNSILEKSKITKGFNDMNISQSSKFQNSKDKLNSSTFKKDYFDPKKLTHELIKEYSQIKISKDASFIDRMQFDVFKREKQEQHISNMIEKNKPKLDEEELVKTFNRLIVDANRRIEAQQNIEQMKSLLEEKFNNGKKYKTEEWEYIYNQRFLKFVEEKNKKIDEMFKQKKKDEKNKEEKELEGLKVIKGPQAGIDQSVQRLYGEGERRKRKLEQKILEKKNYENMKETNEVKSKSKKSKNDSNLMDINDFKEKVIQEKETHNIPSQIPLQKIKYNKKKFNKDDFKFQSDIDSETDSKTYKNSRITIDKNYKAKNTSKINETLNEAKEGSSFTKYNLISPVKNEFNKTKNKSFSKPSETRPVKPKKNQILNHNYNSTLQNNVQELNVEEDTIWNEIPRPITLQSGNNKNDIKTSDLKKAYNFNEENKTYAMGNKRFVSEFEANKFVNNILQSKLNTNNN